MAALRATSDTVAMYIGSQADGELAPATLKHLLATIRLMHPGQGLPSPHYLLPVKDVMHDIRR